MAGLLPPDVFSPPTLTHGQAREVAEECVGGACVGGRVPRARARVLATLRGAP